MYVGTSELHFCSPHWIQKYLNPKKKLSACAKPPYLILPPCIPSPYSVPPHACPPLILSRLMHTLPLFYPSPCIPSPILSHPMHTLPLFYPSLYTPSPYSIPLHTCPPLILSHCMHVRSCSLPAHTCHPSMLFQLMHALLTPCHMSLEGMFLLWHLRMPFWISSHWVYHHHLPSLVIWSINL